MTDKQYDPFNESTYPVEAQLLLRMTEIKQLNADQKAEINKFVDEISSIAMLYLGKMGVYLYGDDATLDGARAIYAESAQEAMVFVERTAKNINKLGASQN